MSTEMYVSPSGSDDFPGTKEQPLATLTAARDTLRRARQAGNLSPEGARITLRAGTYRLDVAFLLEAQDSGAQGAPLVFAAAEGERVILTGGVSFGPDDLDAVTDPAVLGRLPDEAREQVKIIDLSRFGIDLPASPSAAELTFRSQPMTLARWPNAGYARLGGAPEVFNPDGTPRAATLEDGFLYGGDRPRNWQAADEAWIHVWGNDWATERVRVASIDLEQGHVRTCPPYGSTYGFPKNGRYFWFNILEELDEPGEYYLDRKNSRLYLWVPAEVHPGDLTLALLEEPLIQLNDASLIRFENLNLRHGRKSGMVIRGGGDVTVSSCRLSCFAGSGVEITGGHRHAVRACEVCHVGSSGISLSGGDRRTLERADHAVENNHIHHYAQWNYCYNGAINVGGGSYGSLMGSVGIRLAHNRIHDCPHNGILYWGNDMEIEYNDIYRVVMESTDAGAIYTGRDFVRRGSVIRYNYIHHNGEGGPFGTMGVYLDDCSGGDTVFGNVLQGLTQAVYMGGGTDTVCENNLFVDCDPALHLDMRGILGGCAEILKERFYEVNAHLPPYITHYPELARIHAHYEKKEGIPPEGTRVMRNIAVGEGEFWSYTSSGVDRSCLVEENNLACVPLAHLDLKRGGLSTDQAAKEAGIGFERIPMEKIGLVPDAHRAVVSPRSLTEYRLVVDTPWSWLDNVTVNPVLRLEVVNMGEGREAGVAELFVSPAEEASVTGNPRLTFDLAPGESVRSAPITLLPGAALTHLELGIRRLGTLDLPVWHWLYLQHTLTTPRLGSLDSAEGVVAALAHALPLRTAPWDGRCGEVRMGLTEGALAILFDLKESELISRLDDNWWRDSCIELFGFGPAHPIAEQVGLVPASAGVAARVLWFHNGRREEAAEARIFCESSAGGYRLAALIPDRLLGWDRSKADPTLEISICIKPETDRPRERIRLFGVEIWMNERKRFARLS